MIAITQQNVAEVQQKWGVADLDSGAREGAEGRGRARKGAEGRVKTLVPKPEGLVPPSDNHHVRRSA